MYQIVYMGLLVNKNNTWNYYACKVLTISPLFLNGLLDLKKLRYALSLYGSLVNPTQSQPR